MTLYSGPVIIGCDHAAVELKHTIIKFLETQDIEVTDAGTNGSQSVDYPDIGHEVARRVARGEFKRGVLICGTGLGMSMAANRHQGIRAALCHDLFAATLSRRHNNANILVLGGRVIGDVLACEVVRTWLDTPFEGERHQQRIDKLDQFGES
jgi:ribose 5-phosphate isomerase B